MIYLRFEICGENQRDVPRSERGIADFMFEAADPRECTRKAIDILRNDGWKAVALRDAQEGFALADFTSLDPLEPLFNEAEVNGLAYELNVSSLSGTATA
jgi:hypothetical protein